MAYDEALVMRIRERLGDAGTKRMFGGLVFLPEGAIAVGVYGPDLLVRVGAGGVAPALARPGVRPFEMGGRPTRGFVLVAADTLDDETLDAWIATGRQASS
ncbi:TfoX/Sxy family protein [Dactylosporangium salmoneum]|uniref:TfoX/Sxy family protein n=1 Tax=Dactylosporangium salmoneum TaxID=53361 RepID=A0ABN3I125_9ACTN